MCAPVRWADAMAYLHRQRPALYLDVGPGNVLKGLLLRNARDARCLTCGTPRDILLAQKQLEAA
jgi:malonyl CoA-acyl carrier protein transacylase